ncbi:hypothetical protein HMPREF9370_0920 [Neisseria wadsworthii 9715]|uniref:Uncharacterized protein n=1 Tax=Neisseria wadsworthii 9715 TaxID=1030841 RepID=G4CPB0_9NEIS|nr:hypothetical protein HMPREF9370_0920 [Neisseria wadsworthii 9715]
MMYGRFSMIAHRKIMDTDTHSATAQKYTPHKNIKAQTASNKRWIRPVNKRFIVCINILIAYACLKTSLCKLKLPS